VNYVGSLNRRLPLYTDLNPPQFNITAAGTSGGSCTDLTKARGLSENNKNGNKHDLTRAASAP